MSYVEKRVARNGQVSYRVKIRIKGFPTESASFARRTDAVRWGVGTEADMRAGRYLKSAASKRHTVGELIDRYIQDVLPQKLDHRNQSRQLAWWKQRLGRLTLADLTTAIIAEQRDRLLAGTYKRGKTMHRRSPATAVRYMAAFSHALSVAVKEWQWLEQNPIRDVRRPKEPRGRVRFLSHDERHRLLKACLESKNPALYTMVVLAISTGMRLGEIANLRRGDFDPDKGTIILERTKNGERRAVALKGLAETLVRKRLTLHGEPTDLLFPGANRDHPVWIGRAWRYALRRADINNFRFHDLRHTAATYLVETGASIPELSEILGHKTLAMVKRYSHLSQSHSAKLVGEMNERIFGGER